MFFFEIWKKNEKYVFSNTARRYWTEQYDAVTAWSSWETFTTKQNRIYQIFFRESFNQRRLQFLFAYSFSNWLAVWLSRFSFWKALVKCPSFSINGIFDDARHLRVCWSVGLNFLMFLMIRARITKLFKFVKVVSRIGYCWLLFSADTV